MKKESEKPGLKLNIQKTKKIASFTFMAEITICNDFGAPKNKKSDTVSTVSPPICHEMMGPDAIIFVF